MDILQNIAQQLDNRGQAEAAAYVRRLALQSAPMCAALGAPGLVDAVVAALRNNGMTAAADLAARAGQAALGLCQVLGAPALTTGSAAMNYVNPVGPAVGSSGGCGCGCGGSPKGGCGGGTCGIPKGPGLPPCAGTCMLGFESPEDVAPSLILASLRELLKRRNAAELALAHATMRDLEAVDTSDLIDEDPPFAAEAEEQAMRELADEAVRQRHHFETLAEQLAGGDIDGALALLREILSPAAAGPSRTSREAEGGNGAAPAARGEDLP